MNPHASALGALDGVDVWPTRDGHRLRLTLYYPCCGPVGDWTDPSLDDLVAAARDHTCHDDTSEELDAEGRRDDAR